MKILLHHCLILKKNTSGPDVRQEVSPNNDFSPTGKQSTLNRYVHLWLVDMEVGSQNLAVLTLNKNV